jgi:hypothetical protein
VIAEVRAKEAGPTGDDGRGHRRDATDASGLDGAILTGPLQAAPDVSAASESARSLGA